MRLSGDFSKLSKIVERFGLLGPRTLGRMNAAMGKETLKLIDEEFKAGRGPDGQQWKHPKHRKGRPMLDTWQLRKSFGLASGPWGYSIHNSRPYSGFLQGGTAKMAPRKMVPEDKLTWRWRTRIFGSAVKALKKALT